MINTDFRRLLNELLAAKDYVVHDKTILVRREQCFPIIQTYPVDFDKAVKHLLWVLDNGSNKAKDETLGFVLSDKYDVDQVYNALMGIMVGETYLELICYSIEQPHLTRLSSIRLYVNAVKDKLFDGFEIECHVTLNNGEAIDQIPQDIVELRLAHMLFVRELNMRLKSHAYRKGNLSITYDNAYVSPNHYGLAAKIANKGLVDSNPTVYFRRNDLLDSSIRSEKTGKLHRSVTLRPDDIVLENYLPVELDEYDI